jgi:hypothetical protein
MQQPVISPCTTLILFQQSDYNDQRLGTIAESTKQPKGKRTCRQKEKQMNRGKEQQSNKKMKTVRRIVTPSSDEDQKQSHDPSGAQFRLSIFELSFFSFDFFFALHHH